MDYTKAALIEDAIRKLEVLGDILNDCNDTIISAIAERRSIRHLLFLACEKEEK